MTDKKINNKTIIFVQNIEFPQQGAVDIFYYSKFLSKYKDINVKVIISKINEDITNKNLEIIELGKVNYFSFIFKAFFKIKKINKESKLDYVYFFAQNPFSVILQFFVKYFLKIKTIYDVVSGPIGRGLFAKISEITIKMGVYISDRYVVLDKFFLERFNFSKKKKYEVISMGYNSEIFKEKKSINIFNRNDNEIIFTYIGSLNKERKLDIFLKAFIENLKTFKNIKLYFIGSGSGENNLRNISQNYKNIFFLGKVKHKKIPDYINSSDILVSYVPKLDFFEYQTPTKLIEYLACNKPVISTNIISQEKILKNYKNLTHKDDLFSTKNKIKYFIENIGEIKKIKFNLLIKNYNWEDLIKKIRNLIFD